MHESTCLNILPNCLNILPTCWKILPNILLTGEATTQCQGKINLKVPDGISFWDLPSFLGQEMLAKYSYFWRGYRFTHSPLIFVTESVIILLRFELVCLAEVCKHLVLLNFI